MAAKIRPALVVSVPPADEDRALVTVVPHTTSVRRSRFEAPSSVRFLKAGAFDIQGILSIPLAKLMRSLGVLPPEQMATVERILIRWLGLPISKMEGGA
jgi:mRNA interferase MazF